MYIVGCDDIDFSNPDSLVWIFEINQWRNNIIPKNTAITGKISKEFEEILTLDFEDDIKVLDQRVQELKAPYLAKGITIIENPSVVDVDFVAKRLSNDVSTRC